MIVELVQATTKDGVVLDGALHEASPSESTPPHDGPSPGSPNSGAPNSGAPSIDALICISGVGSNFYGSKLIETLAVELANQRIATLRINTRGHDGVCTVATSTGGRLQGAAYEIVGDCRHDIEAWVELFAQRGFERIGILGHSLGALKALYSQAERPHPAVAKVIAVSPPCLSYRKFVDSTQADSFRNSMSQAVQLVQNGSPQMLFQATFPFPLILSAATYIDKYGDAERYNLLRFANRVLCDLHFVFGEIEMNEGKAAFDGIVESLRDLNWATAPTIKVIEGANHFYSRRHDELVAVVKKFVLSQPH